MMDITTAIAAMWIAFALGIFAGRAFRRDTIRALDEENWQLQCANERLIHERDQALCQISRLRSDAVATPHLHR